MMENEASEKLNSATGTEHEENDSNTDIPSDRDYQYAKINIFSALAALYIILTLGEQLYLIASLRMLEKQYGFTATQTSLLLSIDNVTSLVMILIVGYLGDRYSKPRILAACYLTTAVGVVIEAMPYFLYKGNSESMFNTGIAFGNMTNMRRRDILCNPESVNISCTDLPSEEKLPKDNEHAYYVLIAARLLVGIGIAPRVALSMTYIYENTPKTKASMYIGKLST